MRLIASTDDTTGKWYLYDGNNRRWVFCQEALKGTGLIAKQLELVSLEEVNSYPLGPILVKKIKRLITCTNSTETRAYLTKDFVGRGVEFGASTNPSPVPLGCRVEYADLFTPEEGCNIGYSQNMSEFVSITHKTGCQDMVGIDENSLEFIISSHVLEHVTETIRSIKVAWEKLRIGGVFLLAIPHKDYCFDKPRELTTLAHFIDDYEAYSKSRDLIHIIDVFANTPLDEQQSTGRFIYDRCVEYLNGQLLDIHYHTFNEENTRELLLYFNEYLHRWAKVEIIDRATQYPSNEFFVRLTK